MVDHTTFKVSKVITFYLIIIIASGWCYKTSFSHSDEVTNIEYSPDSSMILTASVAGNKAYVYDANTYILLFTYSAASKNIKTARFSKNGLYIGVGFSDGTINIINGKSPFSMASNFSYTVSSNQIVDIDFSNSSSKLLVCYSNTGLFRVIDNYAMNGPTSSPVTTSNSLLGCKFSQADHVIVIDNNKKAFVYLAGATTPNTTATSSASFTDLDVKPSAIPIKTVMAGGPGDDRGQYFFDGSSSLFSPTYANNPSSQLKAACYAKDSSYYAMGGDDEKVYFFTDNNNTNTLTDTFSNSITNIESCAFNYKSDWMAAGTETSNSIGYVHLFKRFCVDCPVGFYASTTGTTATCVQCDSTSAMVACANCQTATVCLDCFQGYFINSTSFLCVSCNSVLEGCSTCTNTSICIQCNSGYYLNSGVCQNCSSISAGCLACNSTQCTTCQLDYYLSGLTCLKCSSIPNCLRCSSNSVCLQCSLGWFVNSNACSTCNSLCFACQGTTTNCSSCVRGYYPLSNVCTACGTYCLQCNTTGYCLDCKLGTFVNSGACDLCTSPCSTCSTSATTCLSCVIGFYLSANVCNSCSNNCASCISATNCSSCFLGFYLTGTNTCSACSNIASHCTSCSSVACLACDVQYYLASTTSCLLCNNANQMPGCTTCISNTICLTCTTGYYLTASTGINSCATCGIGCQTCTTTACTNCLSGYFLATSLCSPCQNNCLTCNSSTYCFSCNQGYLLSVSGASSTCTACSLSILNCVDCLTSSYCLSCSLNYYLITSNASCSLCAPTCVTCNSTACFSCQLGYYLSAGSCLKCGQNCSECTSMTNCQTCNVGYFLNTSLGSDQCRSCSLVAFGCMTCNVSYCFTCSKGMYFDSISSLCKNCINQIDHCIDCASSAQCNYCSFGYYVATPTLCSSCSSLLGCHSCTSAITCVSCMIGYYLSGSSCVACSQKCITCSSTQCLTCTSGYIFNSIANDCSLCSYYISGCEVCSSTTTCIKCDNGYYLQGLVCLNCKTTMVGCEFCNSSSVCTLCQEGYYLDTPSNTCKFCSLLTGCQVCSSSSVCLSCQNGYYLSASNCLLCISNLPGCLFCQSNLICQQCQSGYYLDAISKQCSMCQNSMVGCIFCSSNILCLQCSGGYYLDSITFKCKPCLDPGCQICLQSNPIQCVTCNSGYYYNINICSPCSIDGCLQCSSSSTCTSCSSGYYLSSGKTCVLCSNALTGCGKCSSISTCLQCKSMYYLNGAVCSSCASAIQGCSFCNIPAQCATCDSGFYLTSTFSCSLCSMITGCLMCSGPATCQYCQSGYYLSANTCNSCSVISNCYDCLSSTTCIACLSGFSLSPSGSCAAMQISSGGTPIQEVKNLLFKTYYVSSNLLKHILEAKGMNYQQINQNWQANTKIYLQNKQGSIALTILFVEWGSNGRQLIFYTNNPLTVNILSLPVVSGRLMLGQSISPDYSSSISLAQGSLSQILPNYLYSSDLLMTYSLNDPEFYSSYIYQMYQTYYYIFGVVITSFLFIMFLVKSLRTVPYSNYQGDIIGHIFSLKTIPLILYPTYGQYINYSYGFMTADIPWFNKFIPQILSDSSDYSALGFRLFFINMNMASMYLIALTLILLILGLSYICLKPNTSQTELKPIEVQLQLKNHNKWTSICQFLYNFFGFGLIFSACASLLGALYNSSSIASINGSFYILGVLIYALLFSDMIYKLFKQNRFSRLRLVCKATLLAASISNPIYIFTAMIVIDLCLTLVEYRFRQKLLLTPKSWIANQIMANIALAAYFYVPDSLLALYVSSALVVTICILQIYIHHQQNSIPESQYPTLSSALKFGSNMKNGATQDHFWNMTNFGLNDPKLEHGQISANKDLVWEEEDHHNSMAETKFIQTHKSSASPEIKKRNRKFKLQDPHNIQLLKVMKTAERIEHMKNIEQEQFVLDF